MPVYKNRKATKSSLDTIYRGITNMSHGLMNMMTPKPGSYSKKLGNALTSTSDQAAKLGVGPKPKKRTKKKAIY